MRRYDLNLLEALDVLLAEQSVTAAAQRLGLSESAMSRTLGRIRETFDDPILVRAGRALVPTTRALSLRDQVRAVLASAHALASPKGELDPAAIERLFTIRANDGFVAEFGADLIRQAALVAPGVKLRFAAKPDKDPAALRDGLVDLDIGVESGDGPEIKRQTLLRDRFVGVVAADHPLAQLNRGVAVGDYTAFTHVSVSRRGLASGPIDLALKAQGGEREVVAVVASFPSALALARRTRIVANVPERQICLARAGMFTFDLPVTTPEVIVAMMWHPRFDADAELHWLRALVYGVCRSRD